MKRFLGIFACFLCVVTSWAQVQEIDAFNYSDLNVARAAWKPIETSPQVQLASQSMKGRRGLVFPCPMSSIASRVYWDQKVRLDLVRADRIAFWVYVPEKPVVALNCTLYFQSGEGWYGAFFSAEKGWNRIILGKAGFRPEGNPSGWDKVETIRFAVWKSANTDTSMQLSEMVALESKIAIIVPNADQLDPRDETSLNQAKYIEKIINDIGGNVGQLSDADVAKGALANRKTAILPYNPSITSKSLDELELFVSRGGQVIAFYSAPPRLFKLLGMSEVGYVQQKASGQFDSMRIETQYLPGSPATAKQASWNIINAKPARTDARVVGTWFDQTGQSTGYPALIISDNGAFFSHILLSDDYEAKKRLMLALLGKSDKSVWKEASNRAIGAIWRVGPFAGSTELTKFINSSKKPSASQHLGAAKHLETSALKSVKQSDYASAIDLATSARKEASNAYCASQTSRTNEIRAAWCHSAAGVAGETWDTALAKMKANGMNAVFPNMLWGGLAYYKSQVLPIDPSVATLGDRIAECVAAGKKHSIAVHVWKVNWNLMNAPKDFVARMREEGRTQVSSSGEQMDWLCPSHPDNFALERDSMLEVARNYDVTGIHFDYIRYPDGRSCYCQGCRSRFEKQFSLKVDNWPQDVLREPLRSKYLAFRRSNITRLVKAVSSEAKKIRPGIQISAAVFSDWPQCRDSVGQDWVQWAKDGLVDFVCPMNYTPSAGMYQVLLENQTKALGKAVPYIPGVGVTLGDWTLTPDQAVQQINLARKAGSNGFILFNLDAFVLDELLPAFKLGITSK